MSKTGSARRLVVVPLVELMAMGEIVQSVRRARDEALREVLERRRAEESLRVSERLSSTPERGTRVVLRVPSAAVGRAAAVSRDTGPSARRPPASRASSWS